MAAPHPDRGNSAGFRHGRNGAIPSSSVGSDFGKFAAIPDLFALTPERGGPTLLGPSASHSEQLFLPDTVEKLRGHGE
jgi:hypothetical protein